MLKTLDTKEMVWLEDVLNEMGILDTVSVNATDKGIELEYDPNLLTAHHADEMVARAGRDELFTSYFVDVKGNKVHFEI